MYNLPVEIIQHHIINQLKSKDILNLLSINKYFYSLRFKLIFSYRVDENIFQTNIIIIFTNL